MKHLTPLQLAESLRHKKDFVWLDSLVPSASATPVEQGLSLLAAEPDLILEGGPNDWPLLEKELKNRLQGFSANCELRTVNCSCEAGAAIGFFRYDGSFRFGFYEKVYQHLATEKKSEWLTTLPALELQQPTPFKKIDPLDFQDNMTRDEFCEIVREAQREIALGNIYQICLAHRFQAACQTDPWPLYLSLRQHSPAPFAAYLQCGEETILSSSPECFLKMEGRHILTRPIKGTRPRGKTAAEDAEQAALLQASSKENAELVMITDLERNDLGRVCNYGSVITSQLLHLERYPQVFHLVSTIQGQLRQEISHVEAFAACFPGGSISGAPKKKAMEIIQRLEPVPRELFTGAIGYFGFDGKSQFNIAIRTLHLLNGIAQFHVGAGITSDSIPEQEWEETLHKAAGILTATQALKKIEE
ncbi:MAG: aminodeoxychorismate synthase component I [Chthoniobacterales bacterium]|nr:aminodeoxychorismate synthase component I [Chthoniobacterales bacterium]